MRGYASGLIMGWLRRTDGLPPHKPPFDACVSSVFIGPFVSDFLFAMFVMAVFRSVHLIHNSSTVSALGLLGVFLIATLGTTGIAGALAGLNVWYGHRTKQVNQQDGKGSNKHERHDINCPSAGWWIRFGMLAASGDWFIPSPPAPELVAVALPFLGVSRKAVENTDALEEHEHRQHERHTESERQQNQGGCQVGNWPSGAHPQTLPSCDAATVHGDTTEWAGHSEAPFGRTTSAHEDSPHFSARQPEEESVSPLVDGYGNIDCQPGKQTFVEGPLPELCDCDDLLSVNNPIPTWQIIPYTVLRYVVLALSLFAAVRAFA